MIYLLLTISFFTAKATAYSCKTFYDQLNIPHVDATSKEEFYYCFGLHHGRDRAWSMDYFRRVAQGKNAEVLGFSHLKTDLMMRLLNIPAEAEKLWTKFPATHRKWLEIYSLGVNEGFKNGRNSPELQEMGIDLEPWKPQDSLSVLLLQSFDQTRKTFFTDYEEELLKEKWGEKATTLFDEDNSPWENTILKEGEYRKSDRTVKTSFVKTHRVKLWAQFPTLFGLESGSNNWVVSKNKSKSGKALLANDPHLDLKTPLFWYWISLKSPDLKVIGASVPGVPLIASGTNGKVSWGLTNSYLNSADVVMINDLQDSQIEGLRPLVMVKFGFLKLPFFFKKFEKLKSGHIILPLETQGDQKLVLRWTGFDLSPDEVTSIFDFSHSSNVSEMDQATSKIGIPSWNFVFADVKGEIGYRLVGKTFRHVSKMPFGIQTMSFKDFLSPDILKPSERPRLINPSRNYIYTANNRHWPVDSLYYGGRGYSKSYRGFRLDELIKEGFHDHKTFQSIQCDRQVVDARFFKDRIAKILGIKDWQEWNMLADDHSKILPVYRRIIDLVMEKWNVNEHALYKLLLELSETQRNELRQIYQMALNDIHGRSWGEVHLVHFPHLSKNVNWKFAPEISGVGDTHSVDPGTSKWNPERKVYEQYSGASMRMIIEMDKDPKIWLSLPGINRQYHSFKNLSAWSEWKNCQYKSVEF